MVDIDAILPRDLAALPTEANLGVANPWFAKSLELPGDIMEIGCFRGTMSLKYAFVIAHLQQQKVVHAFDTFEGFLEDDPTGGGSTKRGDYSTNDDAYESLLRWGRILPLVPVRGDIRSTLRAWVHTGRNRRLPLSFVWLDLDIAALMDFALTAITPALYRQTIIGVDDYGRPECPSVGPWADALEASGRLAKLGEGPEGTYIAFYQRR